MNDGCLLVVNTFIFVLKEVSTNALGSSDPWALLELVIMEI